MEFNFFSFVLDNFESAGAIGGYVSLSIIGFALIGYFTKQGHEKLTYQISPKYLHPVIGSFLGAIPGCGATIIVASLYKNNKISFGGLLATFISTIGEGSFVLLGASNEADVIGNLKAYVIITVFGLIAGIIFGYLFDIFDFKLSDERNQFNYSKKKAQVIKTKQNMIAEILIEKVGFYAVILMALFLAPGSIMALWGGSIESIENLTYWSSISFAITCIFLYFISTFIYNNHDCFNDLNSIRSTMLHAVLDVAMVVTYVVVGLFVANYVIDIIIGEETFNMWMQSSSFIVVLLASLIAVTPGCGGMIAVAVAFITIADFPIAALIAASIATSGDGIFPLFAENKKDAIVVSIIGLLVALLVGYFALYLGL